MEAEKKDTVTEIAEVVRMVANTNEGLVIREPLQVQLIEDLTPVAERMGTYAAFAAGIEVVCQKDADFAMAKEKEIANDVKAIKGNEILSKIIKGLHNLHKDWKGLENRFVPNMDASRKAIRAVRIKWEEEQAELAAAAQRKLQAAADEKARKERENQERLAKNQRDKENKARQEEEAALKAAAEATDEKERKRLEAEADRKRREAEKAQEQADMREDNAAAVAAPVVSVQAPRAVGGSRMTTVAEIVNQQAFFQAVATNPQLAGFVEIKHTALAGARRANAMFTVPGVTFKQVRK